jgi:hypothetical protein
LYAQCIVSEQIEKLQPRNALAGLFCVIEKYFFCNVRGKYLNAIGTRYTTKLLLPLEKKHTFLQVIGSFGLSSGKEMPS